MMLLKFLDGTILLCPTCTLPLAFGFLILPHRDNGHTRNTDLPEPNASPSK